LFDIFLVSVVLGGCTARRATVTHRDNVHQMIFRAIAPFRISNKRAYRTLVLCNERGIWFDGRVLLRIDIDIDIDIDPRSLALVQAYRGWLGI
jgi:hypothetical protein